jgi:hypothetical protein
MSTAPAPASKADRFLLGGALVMVLCCAVGPAVIGVVASSAVGGGLGIVIACVVAAALGLGLYWRRRDKGC